MRYFSQKEILIGVAAISWIGLLCWFLIFSDKTFGDIGVNLITDILFAVFVVFFIEYANKKDRDARHRSRQRAIALAVQHFYQRLVRIIQAMVADGVTLSPLTSPPTCEMIIERAESFRSRTAVHSSISEQPVPYAAYFICDFRGSTTADVLPVRTTNEWLRHLATEVGPLYRDVFFLDAGFLPDEVVVALSSLIDFLFITMARDVFGTRPIKMGFWPEEDLHTATVHMTTLHKYFAPLLGYALDRGDGFLCDAVLNAFIKKSREDRGTP